MNRVVMGVIALGAVIGGVDDLLGNRLGLGQKFEQGFQLLGTTALSMVGIICFAPLLSGLLASTVSPVLKAVGVDPSMLGGLLALDMGGYPLAKALAVNPTVGRYAGIMVGATFGCTLTFTIPVGVGMMEEAERGDFAQGVLVGLIALPVALIPGALLSGLTLGQALGQNAPILLLAGLVLWGLARHRRAALRGFAAFAKGLRALTIVGLTLAAAQSIAGVTILPGMAPIEDAMATVSSIGVVLLGSLPAAELLTRALRRPCRWLGRRVGLDELAITGLLVGMVSAVPVMAMLKDMSPRGRLANVAFMVSGSALIGAHLGFVAGSEPDLLIPMLLAKLLGGCAAVAAVLAVERSHQPRMERSA